MYGFLNDTGNDWLEMRNRYASVNKAAHDP